MTYYSSATEVLPGLWIGDRSTPYDIKFTQDKNIQFIINCSSDPNIPNNPSFILKYHFQAINKYNDNNVIYNVIDEYCKLIQKYIKVYNILIYCENGIHESVILIIMYIIKLCRLKPQEVINMIETKRQYIQENMANYIPMFQHYYNKQINEI